MSAVYGLSSQDTDYQGEMAARLGLPFPVLSDPALRLARSLGLPTFEAAGMELYMRLTLLIRNGRVVHWFYPVEAPGEHAERVLEWVRDRSGVATSASTTGRDR